MSQVLRQSTQVIVRIGPAVAVGDGFTPVTTLDLSTADEAELLKANTTTTTSISGATLAAITGCDGWYGLTLTTSLTDTVGCLDVMVNDDSLILPIFARFQVIEEAAYDAMYAASADPKADINVGSIDANVITATSINADAFTAAKFASDVSAEIADAVWDEDATGHQTGGTFGQAIGDPAADTNTIYGAVVTGAAGATVAADIIAVKAETATIVADTNELQTDWANGGRLDLILDARASQTSVDTIDGIVDDILVDTAEIGAAGAGLTAINLPDQTMNITGNITGNLSGSVGSVTGLTASDVGAIKTQTDKLTFTQANVIDAQILYVAGEQVTGAGTEGDPWGPA